MLISTGQPFDWISAINSPSAFVPNSVVRTLSSSVIQMVFSFLAFVLRRILGIDRSSGR